LSNSRPATLDPKTIPVCIYTDPEVAGVGLTETQAREAGYDVRVGRFPLEANGKALTYGGTEPNAFSEVLGCRIASMML
jgi:dihydrolipoamide dehydrogenase